jgi:hypothetical protein
MNIVPRVVFNGCFFNRGTTMKKFLLIGFLIFSANNLFAAWGWSSGSYTVDRYVSSTIGGLPAICLYITNPANPGAAVEKYFIHDPESTVSKALMSEIISNKITGQAYKLYYNGTAVEGDWFELGAIKN